VMFASGDELSHGSACGFLHGDALGVGAFAECCLFAISEAERHGHATMVSVRYRPELPIGSDEREGKASEASGRQAR